ncbi:hypothetical protein [Rufibacter roseus]|nr:hypothetical protein [Rufibacter roseus]
MISFKVVDQNTFEMCFDQEVEGLYSLVITTKSGKEIKRAGQLEPAGASCFQEEKRQFSLDSYTDAQRQFLSDSLTNENIASVKWVISRRHYESPTAEGVFQK